MNKGYYEDLSEYNFRRIVLNSKEGIYLIAFNNEDYALNKVYDGIIKEIAYEFRRSIVCYRIDSKKAIPLVDELGLSSIPIVLFYEKGKVVKNLVGIYSRSHLFNYVKAVFK